MSMEDLVVNKEEYDEEPVTPTGQYFNSSVLSISVLAVLESQIPIDDSPTFSLLRHVFLPINPRFSSIMVHDKNGVKQWKKVDVNLKDHINIPTFPPGKSLESYDNYLKTYLTKISMEKLSQSKPLWEIHIIKFPTTTAAGTIIFKLHHALGDGFSLMGALLSCLQRADDPSLPLNFPSFGVSSGKSDGEDDSVFKNLPKAFFGVLNTVTDFGWSILKSSFLEDDRTPVRSAVANVELLPIDITTMTFCLDQIKQIKNSLNVTVNDVITGVIFMGTRLYMKEKNEQLKNGKSTALVLLNTRNIGGYKSLNQMAVAKSNYDQDTVWGNQFGFLHVSLPDLNETEDPLEFVFTAQEIIKRKKNSAAVFLTGRLLEAVRKYRGPQATAEYIHSTLKNSSMTLSNMIGPIEQMAVANHPINGLYFMVVGVPQSLTITMMSYMQKLRVAVGTEKGYIDSQKFKSCIENAFQIILKDALKSESKTP